MTEETGEVSERPTTSPWVRAAVVVVGVRVVFFAIAYAASYYLSPDTEGPPGGGVFDLWVQWDALRFLTTSEHGYTSPAATPNATAFFPLFPLALRPFTLLGFSPALAGAIVSGLASWVALAYLYRLAEHHHPGTGTNAMLYLALFPTALFLIAPYSESLFLAGAIAAFFYARSGRWHLVGIPAAVAMGSRFAGVFLLAGLLIEFLRQGDRTRERVMNAAVSLVVGTLPLLAYAAYLAQVKGDPLYFFVDQRQGWGRTLTSPLAALSNSFDRLQIETSGNLMMIYRLEIVGAAVGIAFVAWALAKREWGYAAFMGLTLAALLVSSEYMSIPRILVTFFPVSIFAAQLTRRSATAHEIYLFSTTALMTMGVLVYTRGGWYF